jgi:hypothetical protein
LFPDFLAHDDNEERKGVLGPLDTNLAMFLRGQSQDRHIIDPPMITDIIVIISAIGFIQENNNLPE